MNETHISDALVEKIRKLLALGSNLNDSPEQAELALKKAKELATQNDIDLATIEVFQHKKSEEPVTKSEGISLGQRQSVAQKFISWILQNHFGVRIIYSGGRYGGKTLTLIGTKTDINIATYVQSFLNQEFMNLWHNYRRLNLDAQTKDRNSFMYGLYNGLSSKLDEQKKSTVNDTFSSMSAAKGIEETNKVRECYSLTIVSKRERLEKAVEEFYPRLRSTRHSYGNGRHNASASQQGFAAGRNITIRPGIGAGNGGQLR